MNDFTKEELQILHDCCDPTIHDSNTFYYEKERLQAQLKDMIDNYCHHAWGCEKVCLKCKVSEQKCNKCAEIIYEGIE